MNTETLSACSAALPTVFLAVFPAVGLAAPPPLLLAAPSRLLLTDSPRLVPSVSPIAFLAAFLIAGSFAGVLGCRVLRRARSPAPVSTAATASVTGVLWLVVGWCWLTAVWPPWWLPVPLVVTTLVVPLTLADLRHRRLPDVLTLPAYPLVGAAVLVAGLSGPGVEIMRRACVAGAVFGGAHLLVHALSRRALGGGDVKLAGALGVALGAVGWVALLVAAALAGVVSVFLSFVPRWRDGVPHGPGLSIAAWLLTVFPGPQPEVMR